MTGTGSGLLKALTTVALAIALGIATETAAAVAAYPPQLSYLRVIGGEESWHAENDFQLTWGSPSERLDPPIQAVHYLVKDTAGNIVIDESRIEKQLAPVRIDVPPRPGEYTAEVWLESADGSGQPKDATLRFDNSRPAPVRPLAPSGWIGATSSSLVRIEHPAPPLPISGIRGYAISVDRDPEGSPCLATDRCDDAETDLRGGIEADTISVGTLPEGTSFVHTLAVSGSGMRSATVGTVPVRVDTTPPVADLLGAPHGWASGPVHLALTATDPLSGMATAGPFGPLTSIAIDDGAPRSATGDSVAATVTGSGAHRIVTYARDAAGNIGGSGSQSPPTPAVVRIDEGAPSVGFARAQDPSEPERIEATVTDSLSGPDAGRGSIGVRPAGTRQQFAPLPTAASAGRLVAHWESGAFPTGNYEFRATGYDAAGNSSESDRRANGARMVLANPLKAPVAIQAGFGGRRLTWHRCTGTEGRRRCRREVIESFGRRPAVRSVPYGRGLPFSGRLTSASGSPLGGLPVQVVEGFDSGAEPTQRTTTVETAADGTFVAHLPPGPSRQVEAVFAGNRVLTRATGPQVRLATLSGVRMHASATTAKVGGAPVVFSGRVGGEGAAASSRGRPIELQFRLPGTGWTEFRTVETDARGRFRLPYSFSDDDSRGARFEFRAYAPAQDGWPYEPASSRPIFVTGH